MLDEEGREVPPEGVITYVDRASYISLRDNGDDLKNYSFSRLRNT